MMTYNCRRYRGRKIVPVKAVNMAQAALTFAAQLKGGWYPVKVEVKSQGWSSIKSDHWFLVDWVGSCPVVSRIP